MATVKKAKSTPRKTTDSTASQPPVNNPLSIKVSRKYLLIGIGIIALAVLLYTYRSLFIVATVNGTPISRLTLIQELEKQGGKQTLATLVTKTLIAQEAAKKNISVSQKQIDKELKKIEQSLSQQGQTLDQVLQLQGMTKASLVEQIRTQKMVEALVGVVSVSDKEVATYMEANQASLPQEGNATEIKKNVKTQLQQQKVSQKAQELLQKLQKDAKINYLVTY